MNNRKWEKQARGAKLANKGKHQTKLHRSRISVSQKLSWQEHRNCVVVGVRLEPVFEVKVFTTCAEAARSLQCTKQAVCAAAKDYANRKVKGWSFKYVDASLVLVGPRALKKWVKESGFCNGLTRKDA